MIINVNKPFSLTHKFKMDVLFFNSRMGPLFAHCTKGLSQICGESLLRDVTWGIMGDYVTGITCSQVPASLAERDTPADTPTLQPEGNF